MRHFAWAVIGSVLTFVGVANAESPGLPQGFPGRSPESLPTARAILQPPSIDVRFGQVPPEQLPTQRSDRLDQCRFEGWVGASDETRHGAYDRCKQHVDGVDHR